MVVIKLRKKELSEIIFCNDTLLIRIDLKNKGIQIHRFGTKKEVFVAFYELKKLYKTIKKIDKKVDKKIKITI